MRAHADAVARWHGARFRLRLAPAAVLGVLILLAQVPAQAAHCTTYSTSVTDIERGMIVVPLSAPLTSALDYFYYDACHPDCLFSFGFYSERNGIPGLQRNDASADDTCHGMIRGDLWTG